MINLERLRPSTAGAIVVCIGCAFAVALAIFIMDPVLYWSLETLKLAIICVAISLALIVFNGSAYLIAKGRGKSGANRDTDELDSWSVGGGSTFGFLNILILIGYFSNFSLRTFFIVMACVEILFYGLMLLGAWADRMIEKNNPPNAPHDK